MPTTVKSRLSEIAASLPKRVDRAVKEAAEEVANQARLRAPIQTGSLKASINVQREGPGRYTVVAGDGDVFYGHLVEFGTSHSAPQPFLIPALEVSRPRIDSLISESLRDLE